MPIFHVLLTPEVLWQFVTIEEGIGNHLIDNQVNIRFLRDKIDTGELIVSAFPNSISILWQRLAELGKEPQIIKKAMLFLKYFLIDHNEVVPNCIYHTAIEHCPNSADFDDFVDVVYANEMDLDAIITIQSRVSDYQNILFESRSSLENHRLSILTVDDFIQLLSLPVEASSTSKIRLWTPHGEPIYLPVGSTPVDFAYKIHTQVGNKCKSVLVNEKIVPLSTHLYDGDTVDIIKGENSYPSLEWLQFVKTKTAINGINLWHRNYHAKQGFSLLEYYLDRNIQRNDSLVIILAKKLGFKNPNSLYRSIAQDETSYEAIQLVLQEIDKSTISRQLLSLPSDDIPVVGYGYRALRIASCCKPDPNDSICGAISHRDCSLILHKTNCSSIDSVNPKLILPMTWSFDRCRLFLEIKTVDKPGLIQELLNTLDALCISHDLRGVRTYADNSNAKAYIWVFARTTEEVFFVSQKLVNQVSGLLYVKVLRIMADTASSILVS
ncbi:MAG: TGS domain-containing protein [Pseudanabaena sp.]|jgi:hypothetical protein